MNVENCIEAQYRELMECSEPNAEYADLYKAFTHIRVNLSVHFRTKADISRIMG